VIRYRLLERQTRAVAQHSRLGQNHVSPDIPKTSDKVWTVSELNRMVKDLIEQTFYPFWIRGEIGNLTIHRSGHVYFSLKDSRSQLSCVFFRGAATAQQMKLCEGVEVEAWGRLTVYEPRGQYQVIVERMRTCGVGALQQQFDELKRKLRAEGLFDDERKRPIPVLPRCVGVVTSPQGAAVRDFLNVLGRRFGDMHVRIMPAAVQGPGAAHEVAAGIRYLNETRACDVIVVTRGGGSLEDLWPFNEEVLARAIAASDIPVISAVGHEVDFTISDYVADLRVATPSAAAELVIARKAEMLERVANLRRRLSDRLRLQVAGLRQRFTRAAGHAVFQEPRTLIRLYQQRVDELSSRLSHAVVSLRETRVARFRQASGKLDALNPFRVLERGYSILTLDATGSVVTDSRQVDVGDAVSARLARGGLRLGVRQQASGDGTEA